MNRVQKHYSREAAFGEVGKALQVILSSVRAGLKITYKDLAPLDQFHVGGLKANSQLAESVFAEAGALPGPLDRADFQQPPLVLDAGCGLGGPARHLEAVTGARVVGIDLTPEFCRLAELLNEISDSRVKIICGDILDSGLEDGVCDAIWTQHAAMNIANRAALYEEFHRLLKAGGRLAIHDVIRLSDEPLTYPLPWSSDGSVSHVVSRRSMFEQLETAGFKETTTSDVTSEALDSLDKAMALPDRISLGSNTLPTLAALLGPTFLKARANLRDQLGKSLGLIQTVWQK